MTDCVSGYKPYKTPVKTTYRVWCLYSYLVHVLTAFFWCVGSMVVSLVLIIPAVLAVLYLLIWQTYVLRQIPQPCTATK
jgi:hypothetical protein